MSKKKIIVGISGASGAVLGYELLKALKESGEVETHLVMSSASISILKDESDISYEEICRYADHVYEEKQMDAAISSGSFYTDGMVMIPCSMKTLSGIAHAYDDNLLVRAADVCLKECRKVVLVPREMPLNQIHIQNMLICAQAGYVIMPPVFTFYNKPKTMDDQINHFVGKVMMQFGLRYQQFKPWKSEV